MAGLFIVFSKHIFLSLVWFVIVLIFLYQNIISHTEKLANIIWRPIVKAQPFRPTTTKIFKRHTTKDDVTHQSKRKWKSSAEIMPTNLKWEAKISSIPYCCLVVRIRSVACFFMNCSLHSPSAVNIDTMSDIYVCRPHILSLSLSRLGDFICASIICYYYFFGFFSLRSARAVRTFLNERMFVYHSRIKFSMSI